MTRLAGKCAIVTGAANGIGLACARRLAADGAAVALADVNAELGEAAAKKLRDEGARAIFVATDVTQRAAIEALVNRAVDEYRPARHHAEQCRASRSPRRSSR